MSNAPATSPTIDPPATPAPPAPALLSRLPIDRPAPAVEFLRSAGRGVMDLIAHFWERLPQTPPISRPDLHLLAAFNPAHSPNDKINTSTPDHNTFAGVMLYVPKAYRADVLALTPAAAEAFARYITHAGHPATAHTAPPHTTDLSATKLPPQNQVPTDAPRTAIDFLTGEASGISAMLPLLLPAVGKKSPARQLTNVVMQLHPTVPANPDPAVRLATAADLPTLNRWRRLYKEERGILFDADLDDWVSAQKVFVLESDSQIAAVAKFDLDLATLTEIGGVYTFPEFRQHGFANRIMSDLAARIRSNGKTPTLQVDQTNSAALDLYTKSGWSPLGRLARIWLTAG